MTLKKYFTLALAGGAVLLGASAMSIAPSAAHHTGNSCGTASWYGGKFHGRKTANGETYNMHQMTAAHKTLPFGTKLRVTNKANGSSVVVRINDRGPFIKGRTIDLSKAAASKIGMISRGHAPICFERIG